MGKGAKLLDRMRNNPLDWRMGDVATVCAEFGVTCVAPTKGSHYKISHESRVEILTVPAHRPIKPVYIRDLIKFIDAVTGARK